VEINVNGQQYDDWQQVPEAIRAQLEALLPDADGNGIPDALEGKGGFGAGGSFPQPTVISTSSINFNGKQVNSISDLPQEVVDRIRGAGLGAFLEPQSPPSATSDSAAATDSSTPLASHQVVMNGQVVDVNAPAATPRRWWQFWK
jgi:hypothetical protein